MFFWAPHAIARQSICAFLSCFFALGALQQRRHERLAARRVAARERGDAGRGRGGGGRLPGHRSLSMRKPVARRLKTVKKLASRTLWSLEGVLFPLSRYGGAPIWTGLTVKTGENCPGPIRTLTAATSNLFEVATGSRWKPLAFGGCTFLPFSRSFAFF